PARIRDACKRMRENDARIGEATAPSAGMMAALAQIDDELDWMAAARAEKKRRPIGCGARAVRCNEQVGTQEVMLLRDAKLAQAGRAHFLSHFDENFRVEAEPAALGQDRRERGDVDAVLPLVICSTATVQALTFDREHPRRQSRAPQIIEAAHCVAVPVDQQRERGALLLALGHQKWRTRWIVQNARGEAERSEARHHLVLEIAPQRGSAFRFLAATRNGNATPQIDEKFAAVEIGVRAGDGSGAAHVVTLCGCMLELVGPDNYRPLDIACGRTPRQGR